MAFFSVTMGGFVVTNYKSYGLDNGLSENLLTLIGSLGAIFNAIRFVWSALLDKFSYKLVYGVLLTLQIIFGILIVLCRKSPVLYSVSYCVLMLCEGGHFTILPNITKQIFGD